MDGHQPRLWVPGTTYTMPIATGMDPDIYSRVGVFARNKAVEKRGLALSSRNYKPSSFAVVVLQATSAMCAIYIFVQRAARYRWLELGDCAALGVAHQRAIILAVDAAIDAAEALSRLIYGDGICANHRGILIVDVAAPSTCGVVSCNIMSHPVTDSVWWAEHRALYCSPRCRL